nr:MAG TPA: hypothetical protein [Caudoviricetes sp.]
MIRLQRTTAIQTTRMSFNESTGVVHLLRVRFPGAVAAALVSLLTQLPNLPQCSNSAAFSRGCIE